MTDHPVPSPATLAAATPGSDAARDATAAIASHLSHRVREATERAAADAIGELRALGHDLAPEPALGPLAFRAPAGDGGTLVIEILASLGVGVRLLGEDEMAALLSPPQPSAEESRFYAALDAARQRDATVGWRKMSALERRVLVLGEFEAEVMNGGFSQFFLNSAGDRAAETLAALKKVGARRAAQVLEEAMQLFPGGAPAVDRDARGRQLLEVEATADPSLERLTARFYARGEPIAALAGAKLPE